MAFDIHTLTIAKGSEVQAMPDRLVVWYNNSLANLAGGGAGAVTTAVTFSAELPSTYMALVTPNSNATAYVAAKTSTGLNVVLTPNPATATLAAGTFDLLVLA